MTQRTSAKAPTIDGILLASCVDPDKEAPRVLDLGCGIGTALLCFALHAPMARITGIDKQEELCRLARDNAMRNFANHDITVFHCDILHMFDHIQPDSFDIVMTNPPYYSNHHTTRNIRADKIAANVESLPLALWIKYAVRALSAKGILVLIHRAERLHEIIQALDGLAGSIKIIPVWPKSARAAKLFVITARRNARGASILMPGITLHKDDGSYHDGAKDIFDHGKKMPFVRV
ncbi:MAG: methyltransferase [Pseudomonadota bacterium]